VARDRKRAKQRRTRRGAGPAPNGAASDAGGSPGASPPAPLLPSEAHVPGALEHASAEVDEFDAAIVRGASGVPMSDAPIDTENDPETLSESEIETEAEAEGDLSPGEHERLVASGGASVATPEQASGAPTPRTGNRAIAFLRASWAELQRVQWPDRRQVFQATAVVLGFVVVAGVYLGLADFVAKEIVEFIL
jgi:preprotein translocase subunit SecE